MSITQTYVRPKNAQTTSAGMVITLLKAEKPNSPSAIGGTGTTGQLDCRVQCDADESGGSDVQDLFRLETVPTLNSNGIIRMQIIISCVKGDGNVGRTYTMIATHPENMANWQLIAAGSPPGPNANPGDLPANVVIGTP